MSEFQNTKTFLLKDTLKIGPKKFFFVSTIKDTVPWTYAISDLNDEIITGSFYEKELQKTSQEIPLIKGKGNKLHVKWKGYDNSLNSWIDKNDLT